MPDLRLSCPFICLPTAWVIVAFCLSSEASRCTCETDSAKACPQTSPTQPETPGSSGEAPASPDKDGEFIECRSLPELGQVIFTDNAVRGARARALHKRARVSTGRERDLRLRRRGQTPCVSENPENQRPHHRVGRNHQPADARRRQRRFLHGRLLVNIDSRRKSTAPSAQPATAN